jgi:hypothetical protein
MQGAMKILLWAGRLVLWPVAFYLAITLAANFSQHR